MYFICHLNKKEFKISFAKLRIKDIRFQAFNEGEIKDGIVKSVI